MRQKPLTHTFYLDHDNEQALFLRAGGVNISPAAYDDITLVQISLIPVGGGGPVLIDSSLHAAALDWGGGIGAKLVIDGGHLGDVDGLTAGTYRGRVIAYSADQPTGLVYADYSDYYVVIR